MSLLVQCLRLSRRPVVVACTGYYIRDADHYLNRYFTTQETHPTSVPSTPAPAGHYRQPLSRDPGRDPNPATSTQRDLRLALRTGRVPYMYRIPHNDPRSTVTVNVPLAYASPNTTHLSLSPPPSLTHHHQQREQQQHHQSHHV